MSEEAKIENFDVESLIKLVRNHPTLWDPNHDHYRDREIVRQTWNKVAKQSGIGKHCKGETAKIKWRSLRENFRNELKKAKTVNNDNEESVFDSNWPWFKDMQFLMDVMSPVKRNIRSENNQDSYSDILMETASAAQNSSPFQFAENENPGTGRSLRPKRNRSVSAARKRRTANYNELDNFEEEKFKQIEKQILEEKDDNYRFVMTLVPVLKQLPLYSQLNSRIKIQEILLSELLHLRKNQPLPQRE